MSVQVVGDGSIDQLEEAQEFLVAVSPVMLGNHGSTAEVKRGKQAGRAVADIVVGHPRRRGWHDRCPFPSQVSQRSAGCEVASDR